MAYTHVLFDADDTLFDFQGSCRLSVAETVKQMTGKDIPGAFDIYERNNRRWWDRFEKGEVTMDQLSVGRFVDFTAEMGLTHTGTPEQWRDVYQSHLGSHPLMVEGAEELCHRLKGHCHMYIVTNGIAEVQRNRMSRSAVKDCFEDMFISQELGCRKPQPEYFEIVLGRLGDIDRSRILVVGDSLSSDIAGSIAAGLDVCWYNPHGKDAGNLSPTYTVSRLDEIDAIVFGE